MLSGRRTTAGLAGSAGAGIDADLGFRGLENRDCAFGDRDFVRQSTDGVNVEIFGAVELCQSVALRDEFILRMLDALGKSLHFWRCLFGKRCCGMPAVRQIPSPRFGMLAKG
jgi:hypothetical protein